MDVKTQEVVDVKTTLEEGTERRADDGLKMMQMNPHHVHLHSAVQPPHDDSRQHHEVQSHRDRTPPKNRANDDGMVVVVDGSGTDIQPAPQNHALPPPPPPTAPTPTSMHPAAQHRSDQQSPHADPRLWLPSLAALLRRPDPSEPTRPPTAPASAPQLAPPPASTRGQTPATTPAPNPAPRPASTPAPHAAPPAAKHPPTPPQPRASQAPSRKAQKEARKREARKAERSTLAQVLADSGFTPAATTAAPTPPDSGFSLAATTAARRLAASLIAQYASDTHTDTTNTSRGDAGTNARDPVAPSHERAWRL